MSHYSGGKVSQEAEPMRQREDIWRRRSRAPGRTCSSPPVYLAQLKAESEFADVPAEEMTPAQYREPAARYNGGPYWQSDSAQAYGRGFDNNLDDARNALRR